MGSERGEQILRERKINIERVRVESRERERENSE